MEKKHAIFFMSIAIFMIACSSHCADRKSNSSTPSTLVGSQVGDFGSDSSSVGGRSFEEEELPGKSVLMPFAYEDIMIKNNTGKYIGCAPSCYDVNNLKSMQEHRWLVAPGFAFLVPMSLVKKAIQHFVFRARSKENAKYASIDTPVVIVAYEWMPGRPTRKVENFFCANFDIRGNDLVFTTTDVNYYAGLNSQDEVARFKLPYPFLDSEPLDSPSEFFPWYPDTMRAKWHKKIDLNYEYELYINREETTVSSGGRDFVHVHAYLDMRKIRLR